MAYRDRLAELRLAKARVFALQRELAAAQKQGASADALKREVLFLEKRLLHERNQTKALSQELETPLNVHRWPPRPSPFPTCRVLNRRRSVLLFGLFGGRASPDEADWVPPVMLGIDDSF